MADENEVVLLSRDELERRFPNATSPMNKLMDRMVERQGRDAAGDSGKRIRIESAEHVKERSGIFREKDALDEKFPHPNEEMEDAINLLRKPKKRHRREIRLGDKISRIIHFAIKLARVDGYTDKGEVKSIRGEVIPYSDIKELILSALSPSKNILGQEEFIKLLRKSDINPSLIVNAYIRSRVINLKPTRERSTNTQDSGTGPNGDDNVDNNNNNDANNDDNDIEETNQDNDMDENNDDDDSETVSAGRPSEDEPASDDSDDEDLGTNVRTILNTRDVRPRGVSQVTNIRRNRPVALRDINSAKKVRRVKVNPNPKKDPPRELSKWNKNGNR